VKICLVSREYPPETGWGGIGTYTYHLAHGLSARGHEVHVIAQADGTERDGLDGAVRLHRIRHFRFPTPGLNALFPHSTARIKYGIRVRQKLGELARAGRIDIVESANFAAETLFATNLGPGRSVVRLVTPLDTVLETQGAGLNADLRLACWLERANTRNARGLITSSPAMAEHFRAFYGLEDREIAVCPLGIALPSPEGVPPLEREGSGPLVLFVGTLSRRKGVDTLLEAAPAVLARFPSALFVLAGRDSMDAGGGSYVRRVSERVPERVRDRICFPGYLAADELRRYYASADIVVAPSLFESFGQVVLEGMAYGKPVVASEIPSAMEIVVPGETALTVPPGDAEALAGVIAKLCGDAALRERLGAAGRRRVEENYSAAGMARRTEEIYCSFLDAEKGCGR
jgi:glycogen(starch) synthase